MSYIEGYIDPEIANFVAKGKKRFLRSNLTVLLLAGLASSTCYDTGLTVNRLEDDKYKDAAVKSVYTLVEAAIATKLAKSLEYPDGRKLFDFQKIGQETQQSSEPPALEIVLSPKQEVIL